MKLSLNNPFISISLNGWYIRSFCFSLQPFLLVKKFRLMVGKGWKMKTPPHTHTHARTHEHAYIIRGPKFNKQRGKQNWPNLNGYTRDSLPLHLPSFPPCLLPSFLSYLFFFFHKAKWQQAHLTLTLLLKTRGSWWQNASDMTLSGWKCPCPIFKFHFLGHPRFVIYTAPEHFLSPSWKSRDVKGPAYVRPQVLKE